MSGREGGGGSRRALFKSLVMGGALLAGPAEPAEPPDPCAVLARHVRALNALSRQVDYDDPAQEAAYYARARPIVEAVIATPARSTAGLQAKAQAALWAAGGDLKPRAGATSHERIVASLVADVLELAGHLGKAS